MRLPALSDFLYIPPEDPPLTEPQEILVLGTVLADPLNETAPVAGPILASSRPADVPVVDPVLAGSTVDAPAVGPILPGSPPAESPAHDPTRTDPPPVNAPSPAVELPLAGVFPAIDPTPTDPSPADASSPAVGLPPGDAFPAPDLIPTDPPSPVAELPPEDAFPTLAELDAILAANAGPPPGPGLELRAEIVVLLGLDPAIAADPDLYAGVIAALPDPDADETLLIWLAEAGAELCVTGDSGSAGDWQVG